MSAERTQRSVDLALRLLDHQLVGPTGALLGNVDNLVLQERPEGLSVVGVLKGPAGSGPRQPGLLGDWILALWKRLSPSEDPQPLMVPMSHVRDIGSAVTVSDHAERALQSADGLERWMRRHVISAIPGAKEGDDGSPGGDGGASRSRQDHPTRPTGTQLLSDLLGAAVVDPDAGALGAVVEVRARTVEQTGLEVGPLLITGIVFGRHHLGGDLGYTTVSDQGPWLLARAFQWWHRDDREVRWDAIERVDWPGRRVVLVADAQRRHPYDSHALHPDGRPHPGPG